ncbi:MAG: DUF4215 domain-containing protein [Polyangiaceae bacterium]|jgi:cysteine-rich repeat protein|nr:DUF4215 domain-containing protein [Polyangiaceae bacterium]
MKRSTISFGSAARASNAVTPFRRSASSSRLAVRAWARIASAAGVSLALLAPSHASATPASFTFTAPNPGFVPALLGGQPLVDPEGDMPAARDIVGDSANPLLYVASDAAHIYLRLRVDSNPLDDATNFGPFGWGCFINTDTNLATYEFSTLMDGVSNPDVIHLYENTTTVTTNDPGDPPDLPAVSSVSSPLTASVGHARVVETASTFGGDPDYFVDWVIERSAAIAAGFDPARPSRYYCGSANSGTTIEADCSGGTAGGCPLSSQFSDTIVCDESGCGVCGDGAIGGPEGCDDGNLVNGDGCNSRCLGELGRACTLSAQCASGFCDPASNTCACDQHADCPTGQLCNTTPATNVCVAPGCGNGVKEATEGCDDGNTADGDGCNRACLLEIGRTCLHNAACASSYCDPADSTCACDESADCPAGLQCATHLAPNQCVLAGCGNGVRDASEACDDGNLNNGDGCNAQCLLEFGRTCTADVACASEYCDPGNDTCACDQHADCSDGQLCNTTSEPNTCVEPGCGNGVLEAGEGCDDGNITASDGCNASCLLELGEACDEHGDCATGLCDLAGNICACSDNADCPSGQLCNTTAAPNACVEPGCGNGVTETAEGCDDGNTSSGDGCNTLCLLELGQSCTGGPACDSGRCDPTGNVCSCNQDTDCATGQVCKTTTSPTSCVASGCGNGVIEAGEGCDDDNTTAGDGCSPGCLREIDQPCALADQCATDFCDPADSTCACDDDADCSSGSECNTRLSPHECVPKGCGNGAISGTEACDDGNLINGDGCNAQCLVEVGGGCTGDQICASGSCDTTGQVCVCLQDTDCTGGQLCYTEVDSHACVDPGCGNSIVESGEGCDDGNTDAGDGCSAKCLLEIGQACVSGGVCASSYCDPTHSRCACDGNEDCAGGEACNTRPDPNVCVPAGCGNGVKEATEGCDDGNVAAGDGCSATCLTELGRACPGDAFCASGACDSSALVCVCDDDDDCGSGRRCANSVCVSAVCGNGIIEALELCDDANKKVGDGCSATCTVETGWSCNRQPSKCSPLPQCTADVDCDAKQICNAVAGLCVDVECTIDSDCQDAQTCNETEHTCEQVESEGVFASGGGCGCTAGARHSPGLGLLLSLAGLAALRARFSRKRRD